MKLQGLKLLPLITTFVLILVFPFVFPKHLIATSGCCSGHGGVNCAAGPQASGKVICNDGWRGSSCSYSGMVMCRGYVPTITQPLTTPTPTKTSTPTLTPKITSTPTPTKKLVTPTPTPTSTPTVAGVATEQPSPTGTPTPTPAMGGTEKQPSFFSSFGKLALGGLVIWGIIKILNKFAPDKTKSEREEQKK
jgi:hypothetical protein